MRTADLSTVADADLSAALRATVQPHRRRSVRHRPETANPSACVRRRLIEATRWGRRRILIGPGARASGSAFNAWTASVGLAALLRPVRARGVNASPGRAILPRGGSAWTVWS